MERLQVGDIVRGMETGRLGEVLEVRSADEGFSDEPEVRIEYKSGRRFDDVWQSAGCFTLVSRAETPEPEWLVEARKLLPPGWTLLLSGTVDEYGPECFLKGPREETASCSALVEDDLRPAERIRHWVQQVARYSGLPDPYAKPEPPIAFQVGDRVSTPRCGTGTITEPRLGGTRAAWYVHLDHEDHSHDFFWEENLTLITPAAPVTVQDGAAVLPEPEGEPPVPHCAECGEELSMLGAALCGDCCSEYTPGGCRASRDSRCDLCMAIMAPANPQRMPDFGALNELGFPRMPFRGASANVTVIDEADDFRVVRQAIGGTLLYEAVRDEKPLDAFLAAREARPEPKPAPRVGDLVEWQAARPVKNRHGEWDHWVDEEGVIIRIEGSVAVVQCNRDTDGDPVLDDVELHELDIVSRKADR